MPLLSYTVPAIAEAFVMGQDFLFPVHGGLYPVLSGITSHVSTPRSSPNCGRQDFDAALLAEDNEWATNSPDIITVVYVIWLRNYAPIKLTSD
jgi:hypothetical protein